MANTVKTPRFYVDAFEFYRAIGIVDKVNYDTGDGMFGLNPSRQYELTPTYFSANVYKTFRNWGFPAGSIPKINYVAVLGHNFGDFAEGGFRMRLDLADDDTYFSHPSDYEIINANYDNNFIAEYNGFSIIKVDEPTEPEGADEITIRFQVDTEDTIKVSAVSAGYFFDMPNAPNLSLTMSRQYGSAKEFTTHNGSSVSNTMESKPKWGDLGAWELASTNVEYPNQLLSDNSRRIFKLTFSYMDDGTLFGSNQMLSLDTLTNEISGLTFDDSDLNDDGNFNYNLLTDDSFFSQVWQKTLGGSLPMIMQIDNTNNSPNQFVLCRIKENSLKVTQSAFNVYDISLTIEEIW